MTAPRLTVELVGHAIADKLRPADLSCNAELGAALGCSLLFASDIQQHTGSFKARGALAAVRFASAGHVVTASSGNFGAALAWAAAKAGKRCTVVMPHNSVARKIDAVRSHGATVDLIDTTVISRTARLNQVVAGLADAEAISPYDDERVIFGNATLGTAILTTDPQLDAIVVPIGGGGLASGLCVARDHLGRKTRIYGCEPALGDDAARSLAAGHIVANAFEPATICDGARTLSLGVRNFAILQHGLAGMFTVDDDAVRAAMARLDGVGLAAEPTGALAFAALQQNAEIFSGQRVACVVSGGNRA